MQASRVFLQSYVNSLMQIKANDGREVIKGKVVVMDEGNVRRHARNVQDSGVASWPKPPDGWLAVFVDGSFGLSNNDEGTATIIRDGHGNFVLASCRHYSFVGMPWRQKH